MCALGKLSSTASALPLHPQEQTFYLLLWKYPFGGLYFAKTIAPALIQPFDLSPNLMKSIIN